MNYMLISDRDIANGKGVRIVLWVSGCEHHCEGCQNPETWDRTNGDVFTEDTLNEILNMMDYPFIRGLTLSGGDPLAPYNRASVLNIVREVKERFPDKDIWIYSGYTYQELLKDETAKEILSLADVLVDGPFILKEKSLALSFRGSANQRIIDLKKSTADNVVLF